MPARPPRRPHRRAPRLQRPLRPALLALAAACALVAPGAARAQSLQDLYEAARSYDATYLAARALAQMARESLRRNGVLNVTVHEVSAAEGARGLPGEAPFDVIVLSGSVAEVPRALLGQLKLGGRLAAFVGTLPIMQARLYTRTGDAAWSESELFDTVVPRLEGFGEPSRFRF